MGSAPSSSKAASPVTKEEQKIQTFSRRSPEKANDLSSKKVSASNAVTQTRQPGPQERTTKTASQTMPKKTDEVVSNPAQKPQKPDEVISNPAQKPDEVVSNPAQKPQKPDEVVSSPAKKPQKQPQSESTTQIKPKAPPFDEYETTPEESEVPETDKDESNEKFRSNFTENDDSEEVGGDGDFKFTDVALSGSLRMGRITMNLDSRVDKTKPKTFPPVMSPGELWEDPEFSRAVALKGLPGDLEWKRPNEFRDGPALYTQETSRFDVVQGKLGSCYFLSTLASLADKPSIIKQIIPKQDCDFSSPNYNGVFHARFWRFGQWLDLYVDDRLPVTKEQSGIYKTYGARSSDPTEMWVSLIEKAFAKLQGGYQNVEGGWAGDAFMAMTGGVAERVDCADVKQMQLFNRVQNALQGGSIIACSVPPAKDGQHGLIGGHTYTLTGAAKVAHRGKPNKLLRIRNPWGKAKGEWTGAWSDDADEWNQVSEKTKESLCVRSCGDGEFWINVNDFFSYFISTHICNFSPDFNKDGTPEGLDKVCSILGEWTADTAAGGKDDFKFHNPKYELEIPKKVGPDGTPVVITFMQDCEEGQHSLRLDLYKVDVAFSKHHILFDEITNYLTYLKTDVVTYRYTLTPGRYVLLPTVHEKGKQCQFLIRVFSPMQLSCNQLQENIRPFVRKYDMEFKQGNTVFKTENMFHFGGRWIKDKNAGGQAGHDTFFTNPQYHLTLSGQSPAPISVVLMQENMSPQLAVGFKLYKSENIPSSKSASSQPQRAQNAKTQVTKQTVVKSKAIPSKGPPGGVADVTNRQSKMGLIALYQSMDDDPPPIQTQSSKANKPTQYRATEEDTFLGGMQQSPMSSGNIGLGLMPKPKPENPIGNKQAFMFSYEVSKNYVLSRGKYTLVVFNDAKGSEKDYALTIGTSSKCEIKHTMENHVKL